MTALDVENATEGTIQQSDAGHLLRELVAIGNATRRNPGTGRGAPFIYTFVSGSPVPLTKPAGRVAVKPVAKRERPAKNVTGERSHRATPDTILLLDAVTSTWGRSCT